ncbi:MAG: thiolase family protein [Clostridiales Family XIII bacterium]|jgi:acetyl-CoA C-acetyltransferase|nr:thiolase family protein [Clostridiales Family XIII bacterium]
MGKTEVYIAAGARTAIGTMGGVFASLTALDLSIPVIRALAGGGIDANDIDDVIWGCNYQRTYQENNLARVALVKAGLPDTVPGVTIHRNCASSMSSVQFAFCQIAAGEADVVLAGGGESMSTAPHMVFGARGGKKFGNFELRDSMWDSLTHLGIGPAMGVTAENVAERFGVAREEQDRYALQSQRRAAAAIDAGKFRDEIVPVAIRGRKGDTIVDTDEHPRRGLAMEDLAKLKPAFKEGGTVTAGNASGMNDAAAGLALVSGGYAAAHGLTALAGVVATATAGVDPDIMGIGPVPASRKALAKAGLAVSDIGLWEINEAFASQCLACARELGVSEGILNVNGGGISLGHPVGATGARIIVTLVNEMRRRGVRFGVAALCAGGGQGTAVVVENPQA